MCASGGRGDLAGGSAAGCTGSPGRRRYGREAEGMRRRWWLQLEEGGGEGEKHQQQRRLAHSAMALAGRGREERERENGEGVSGEEVPVLYISTARWQRRQHNEPRGASRGAWRPRELQRQSATVHHFQNSNTTVKIQAKIPFSSHHIS